MDIGNIVSIVHRDEYGDMYSTIETIIDYDGHYITLDNGRKHFITLDNGKKHFITDDDEVNVIYHSIPGTVVDNTLRCDIDESKLTEYWKIDNGKLTLTSPHAILGIVMRDINLYAHLARSIEGGMSILIVKDDQYVIYRIYIQPSGIRVSKYRCSLEEDTSFADTRLDVYVERTT